MSWILFGGCEGSDAWRYPINDDAVLLLNRGIGGCSYGEIWECLLVGPGAATASLTSLRLDDCFVLIYNKTYSLTEEKFVSFNEETEEEKWETVHHKYEDKIEELKASIGIKMNYLSRFVK